jgi:hypothetical protein
MPEQSTTPDLVELTRRSLKAATQGDIGPLMSFFAPDAVYDLSPIRLGTHEGLTAIRGFLEDWSARMTSSYTNQGRFSTSATE